MRRGLALEDHLRRNYQRARIGNYELTHHALRRALERNIHAEWILEAFQSSSRPGAQPGTYKYVGPLAMATLNPETREIITVGYGAFNSPLRLVS